MPGSDSRPRGPVAGRAPGCPGWPGCCAGNIKLSASGENVFSSGARLEVFSGRAAPQPMRCGGPNAEPVGSLRFSAPSVLVMQPTSTKVPVQCLSFGAFVLLAEPGLLPAPFAHPAPQRRKTERIAGRIALPNFIGEAPPRIRNPDGGGRASVVPNGIKRRNRVPAIVHLQVRGAWRAIGLAGITHSRVDSICAQGEHERFDFDDRWRVHRSRGVRSEIRPRIGNDAKRRVDLGSADCSSKFSTDTLPCRCVDGYGPRVRNWWNLWATGN